MPGSFALDAFQILVEQGGDVMWAIFAVSSWMWALILERYCYFFLIFPRRRRQLESHWSTRADRQSSRGVRARQKLLEEMRRGLSRRLPLITTLAALLPVLGLLGTVIGMIEAFQVMTVFGMGNPRGMASAVSVALTTTMAGLVAALPGYFLGSEMRSGISAEIVAAARRLA